MTPGCDPAIPARIGLGACGVWARTCSLLHKKCASRARRLSKVGQDELRLWVKDGKTLSEHMFSELPQIADISRGSLGTD
jgi:hypothetical protein